jgi:V/A-type H+-transporting ATPase subunit I
MLKPRKMSRLLIAASKEQQVPLIRALYMSRLFHIDDFIEKGQEVYQGYRIGHPLEGASEASSELLKIRTVTNTFGLKADSVEPQSKKSSSEIRAQIERDLPKIEKEVEELSGRRARLEAQKKDLESRIEALRPFVPVPVEMTLLSGYESLGVFAGWVKGPIDPGVPHEEFHLDSKQGTFLVLIVPRERRADVERLLQEKAFQSVAIPAETGMAKDTIDAYAAKIASIDAELGEVTGAIAENRKRHGEFLVACDELLATDVEQAEAPLRFATTEHAFIAEGYVPVDEVERLKEALTIAAGGKLLVTEMPIDPARDVVPMEYDNPRFSKPTEMIIDIYSRPIYTELDPTLFVSIIFPIFFGLILGDVGYGLILLATALILRKWVKGLDGERLLSTMRNFAISSIIFGVLFSEFLGYELPWHPILFPRHLAIGAGAEGAGPAIPQLLVMSLWIGILHITLGRCLGMVNHAKQDHGSHRTKAVLANFGWIGVMWGILLLIWSMFPLPLMPDLRGLPVVAGFVNVAGIIGAVLLLLGILFIARENALEIVEMPSIISHTLSYARLVAVGLSSVAIAMVVNFIAVGMVIEPQLENITPLGVVLIIVGVLVFIVGHLGNTALGLIGGGLQSLRLQYVEFFTKFYKGGGRKYNPFGMIKRFTED